MKEIGLILEGGGMRGLYTAGVLDCLMDEGLWFGTIYGVSAGACHACSYCSRQRGRAVRSVVDFLDDKRYMGARSLLRTGDFFGVDMIYCEIPQRLLPFDYDAFERGDTRLYAVATNCRTGEAEYLAALSMRDHFGAVRASSSLPLLSRMVVIGGQPYLDGGVSDSIPLARSIADGHSRNVVVLTQHRGFRKGAAGMGALTRTRYWRWPRLADSIRTRHLRYNAALDLIAAEERAGNTFVLAPSAPVSIGRLEKDRGKLLGLYQAGYDETKARMGEMKAFLTVQPT